MCPTIRLHRNALWLSCFMMIYANLLFIIVRIILAIVLKLVYFFISGNYLVRVRAQVMTRDDSTGGWVPMGAGGLSHVCVCKGSVSGEDDKLEYLIYGKRIADQSVSKIVFFYSILYQIRKV